MSVPRSEHHHLVRRAARPSAEGHAWAPSMPSEPAAGCRVRVIGEPRVETAVATVRGAEGASLTCQGLLYRHARSALHV
jgi:hypothetical protein